MTIVTDKEYIQQLTRQNHELIGDKEKLQNLLCRIDAAITYETESDAEQGSYGLPPEIAKDIRLLLGGAFNEYLQVQPPAPQGVASETQRWNDDCIFNDPCNYCNIPTCQNHKKHKPQEPGQ